MAFASRLKAFISSSLKALVSTLKALVLPLKALVSTLKALVLPLKALVLPLKALVSTLKALVSTLKALVSPWFARRGRRALIPVLAFCVPLLATSPSRAALQGELGVSSTAELDIAVTIHPTIQVNHVSDIQLDIFDVTQDASITQQICIRGTRGGKYSIITSGRQGSASAFVLTNPEGGELPFRLSFTADLAAGGVDDLSPGVASPPYNVLASGANCDGNNTSAFTITFDRESLQDVQTGTYTGYLALHIAAQ